MSECRLCGLVLVRFGVVVFLGYGELVFYCIDDGDVCFYLWVEYGIVWLSQVELVELFQIFVLNINIYIKNVLVEGELYGEVIIKDDLIVCVEGGWQVWWLIKFYNFDMILVVGYWVKFLCGIQFCQWVIIQFREYLVKGFVLDDEWLKDFVGWDYFDELLQCICEICMLEKWFYQKVCDLFVFLVDYSDDFVVVGQFFVVVQNKMLFVVI